MNIRTSLSRKYLASSVSAPSAERHAARRVWWCRFLLHALTAIGSSTRRVLLPVLGLVVMVIGASASSASSQIQAGIRHVVVPASVSAADDAITIDPSLDRLPRSTRNIVGGLVPVRLIIPKMRLNALILGLGPDRNGAMQAPRIGRPNDPIWSDVYWWNAGVMPGQIGNAVIAGHVNRPDASPSTFTYLNRLVPGDQIQVVTRDGHILVFIVTAKDAPLVSLHGNNDPVIERIFGPALMSNLNLMTCWGEWDGKQFNRRLVVYSKLASPSPFPAATDTVPVG